MKSLFAVTAILAGVGNAAKPPRRRVPHDRAAGH
jgi:hypothetical protein